MRLLLAALAALLVAAPAASAAPELVKVGDFHAPVGIASPPGSTDLYVVDQDGKVVRYDPATGARSTFLDVESTTGQDAEQGLLSIAFDPQWATTGRFWVFQTRASDEALLVLRGHRDAPEALTPIVTVDHPGFANHNGGDLHVGPDGHLYISTGDGGEQEDPDGHAQDLDVELGKILRVDGETGQGVPGNVRGRVFHHGMRNPYRFAFDRQTGDMLVGDVGGGIAEEVTFIPAGGGPRDLGWRCWEGDVNRNRCDGVDLSTYTPPAIVLDHDGNDYASVIAGRVVRDPQVPSLAGRFLYGDNNHPVLRAATVSEQGATGDGDVADLALADLGPDGADGRPVTFGEDACGRVHVGVTFDYAHAPGAVYRLQEAGQPSVCVPGQDPPPGGGTTDTRPCAIDVSGKRQRLARRKPRIRVRVSADERCTLTVRARVKGVLRFRSRTVDVQAGQARTVRLRAGRSAVRRLRKALRRRGSVRVRVAVDGRDAVGNASSASARFRLRRR